MIKSIGLPLDPSPKENAVGLPEVVWGSVNDLTVAAKAVSVNEARGGVRMVSVSGEDTRVAVSEERAVSEISTVSVN